MFFLISRSFYKYVTVLWHYQHYPDSSKFIYYVFRKYNRVGMMNHFLSYKNMFWHFLTEVFCQNFQFRLIYYSKTWDWLRTSMDEDVSRNSL